MKSKKFIAAVTGFCMTFGIVAAGALAGAEEPAVLMFDAVSANPGGRAVVPVYVENNPGMDAVIFELAYDSNVLTLLSVEEDELPITYHEWEGELSAMQRYEDTVTDPEFIVCYLIFEVADQAALGEYPLYVTALGAGLGEDNINCEVSEGVITVTDEYLGDMNSLFSQSTTFVIDKIRANPGTVFYVPVRVKNNGGFDTLSLDVEFAASDVTFTGVDTGLITPQANYTDGIISVTYQGDAVVEDGVLFYLQFSADENANLGDYSLDLTSGKISLEGAEGDSNLVDGRFTLTDGAIDIAEDDVFYNGLWLRPYSDHIAIVGCEPDEEVTDIEIPESIAELPVTEIGDFAFSFCDTLTSVKLPGTITTIGEGAFLYCTELTSFTIPDSVTVIGNDSFNMCENVDSFAVSANVQSIGINAFLGARNLELSADNTAYILENGVLYTSDRSRLMQFTDRSAATFTVPDSVTEIDMYAFYNMTALTSVTLPEGIAVIPEGMLYNCTALDSFTIPESVAFIGKGAFSLTAIKEVTIPAGVASIEADVFDGCESLESIHVATENTEYMDDNGILYNKAMTTLIKLPQAMNIETLVLPDSVTKIEESACSFNKTLTEVTAPSGLKTIGALAFEECASLNRLTLAGTDTIIQGLGYTVSNGADDDGNALYRGSIFGESGSPAESYAKENGYAFNAEGSAVTNYGDVNNDNCVDILDVINANKFILGLTVLDDDARIRTDVDCNGVVDSTDSLNILKYVVKLITDFPVE